MTWQIAFVVVGLVWALVVLITVLNTNDKERDLRIAKLESKVVLLEKELQWISTCYRSIREEFERKSKS